MKKNYKIGIIPGDGIGRDVVQATQVVLKTVNDLAGGYSMEFIRMSTGAEAVKAYGDPFPKETIEGIKGTNAVLFGAAGDPHASTILLQFRRGFDLYAKVCPVKAFPGVRCLQPNADLLVVRENTEGLYRSVGYIDGDYHVNLRIFTRKGMERIIHFCFKLAIKEKRKKVTFTHKAGALKYTDAPMKELFYEIAKEYPNVEAEDMMVDACAMHLVMKPERFGVILTENANGDIISDVGAGITGGLGLASSGNIGDTMAVFEPVHGTAPKYAGKDVVNPIATIMAAKMMFDYLGESETGSRIEQAIRDVLVEGKVRTYDLGGASSTTQVAEAISERLAKNWSRI
jgi:3-isopropylmalate dehydrogenase